MPAGSRSSRARLSSWRRTVLAAPARVDSLAQAGLLTAPNGRKLSIGPTVLRQSVDRRPPVGRAPPGPWGLMGQGGPLRRRLLRVTNNINGGRHVAGSRSQSVMAP